MDETSKYLIHADITADGVVERSDVVGAIFGQTEGLLGDELDLRDLQQSSKVGRIDVQIDSQRGTSAGQFTIATSLDKVETATLAAALETITRVGPCRATVEVSHIEDVRAAKRREVVDRAKELLMDGFDDTVMSSQEILQEVREHVRVEDITEYEGLPAGPRVADSDAIIVVEGRADVLELLKFGVKNAIAVEGTNVPDAVADLTADRTVTTFLDGDRGGDLILRELAQVGDVDYVALAPEGRSVEDLERHEVFTALREKVPYEDVAAEADADDPVEAVVAATDGSATPAPPEPDGDAGSSETPASAAVPEVPEAVEVTETTEPTPAEARASDADAAEQADPASADAADTESGSDSQGVGDAEDAAEEDAEGEATPADADDAPDPETLPAHVDAVVGTGTVRFLDGEMATLAEHPADEAFDALRAADPVPTAVVLDAELAQRVLDVAAQRGVEQVVAASLGEFVKRPTSVRIRTVDQLLD